MIPNATTTIIANVSAISRMPPPHPRRIPRAVHAARSEKPAAQNDENQQQHQDVYNPYRDGLVEREHVIKNDKYEHNDSEEKTGHPRHLVAKKTCGELHKPRIGDQTHRYENEPWDDHKRRSSRPYGCGRWVSERPPLRASVAWAETVLFI